MSSAATWMGLEIITLRYRKTNVTWYHFYVESKEMTKMKQTDRRMKQTCLPKRGDGR